MDEIGYGIVRFLLEVVFKPREQPRPSPRLGRRERARRAAVASRRRKKRARRGPGPLTRFWSWLTGKWKRSGDADSASARKAGPRPYAPVPPEPAPARPPPEEKARPIPIGELPLAMGKQVDVAGTAEGEQLEAPVSGEPCVAWWCTIRPTDRPDDVRTAARGVFAIRDESGAVGVAAADARPHALARAKAKVAEGEWAEHERGERLLAAARAAGFDEPEQERELAFVEVRAVEGARLAARGSCTTAAARPRDGAGYRTQVELELRLEPGPDGPVLVSGSAGFPVTRERRKRKRRR
jgi:hypothetical protein